MGSGSEFFTYIFIPLYLKNVAAAVSEISRHSRFLSSQREM